MAVHKTHFRPADTIPEMMEEIDMLRFNLTEKIPYLPGTEMTRANKWL